MISKRYTKRTNRTRPRLVNCYKNTNKLLYIPSRCVWLRRKQFKL